MSSSRAKQLLSQAKSWSVLKSSLRTYVSMLREARRRKVEQVATETEAAKAEELPPKRKTVTLGRTRPDAPNLTDPYLARLDLEADHARRYPKPRYNGDL